jgi:hypothetical protein
MRVAAAREVRHAVEHRTGCPSGSMTTWLGHLRSTVHQTCGTALENGGGKAIAARDLLTGQRAAFRVVCFLCSRLHGAWVEARQCWQLIWSGQAHPTYSYYFVRATIMDIPAAPQRSGWSGGRTAQTQCCSYFSSGV